MTKTGPANAGLNSDVDFITRYFLRRLAKAHRESPTRSPSIQYTNALVETIYIFVGLPVVGLASLILIPSLRWAPNTIAKWFGLSPRIGLIIMCVMSLVIGHRWLGQRLKKYREDRSVYLQFDTERDTKIAFWQKVSVTVVCAIVLPFLAMLVTFGTQVITRAFDMR
jgi:hypothetical protein